MKLQIFVFTIIATVSILFSCFDFVFAQEEPDPEKVKIVGGGGFPIENEKIYKGGEMNDFGTVYSASDDLRISLKDVYLTNNLAVFTVSLGTSSSASNHISSGSVFINNEQRLGGGNAGEFTGALYEQTMTFAFYGGLQNISLGTKWNSLRISFDDLFFTFSDGRDRNSLVPLEKYNWSFVFHNPESDNYKRPTVDEKGIHTPGSSADLWLGRSAVIFDKLYLHLVTKTDRLNDEIMEERLWVDTVRGTVDEELMNLVISDDAHFTRRDQFELSVPDGFLSMYDLGVWAQSVSFELEYFDADGNLQSWSTVLNNKDTFPKQVVRFIHPEARLPMPEDKALYSVTQNGITMDLVSLDIVSVPQTRRSGIWSETGFYDMLLAGICFTAPDDGEWKVIPGSAKAGGIEIMADTLAIGGVVPATAERPGRICGQMGYDITGLELEWDKSINLTVRSLFAQPGERNPCSDIQHRFETNSQAQSMGIRLSCTDNVDNEWIRGPENYTLTVEDWDHQKWTQAEAQEMIEDILDYVIEGNWKFEIPGAAIIH